MCNPEATVQLSAVCKHPLARRQLLLLLPDADITESEAETVTELTFLHSGDVSLTQTGARVVYSTLNSLTVGINNS